MFVCTYETMIKNVSVNRCIFTRKRSMVIKEKVGKTSKQSASRLFYSIYHTQSQKRKFSESSMPRAIKRVPIVVENFPIAEGFFFGGATTAQADEIPSQSVSWNTQTSASLF